MKTLREVFSFYESEEKKLDLSLEDSGGRDVDLKAIGTFLRTLKSWKEIREYCEKAFQYVGAGSYRIVFEINSSAIIKLLINAQEGYQNKNEVEFAQCLGSKHAPVIFDFDSENYYWIIEENVPTTSPDRLFQKLEKILGHTFSSVDEMVRFFTIAFDDNYRNGFQQRLPKKAKPYVKIYEKNLNNEWLMTLKNAVQNCEVASRDFHDENWGIRPSTGELILIDLGFKVLK
jgi:hypothetical protein